MYGTVHTNAINFTLDILFLFKKHRNETVEPQSVLPNDPFFYSSHFLFVWLIKIAMEMDRIMDELEWLFSHADKVCFLFFFSFLTKGKFRLSCGIYHNRTIEFLCILDDMEATTLIFSFTLRI